MSKDCLRLKRLKIETPIENWSENDATFFESHLIECESCQEFVGELPLATNALRSESFYPVVGNDFTSRVVGAVAKDRFQRYLSTWQPTLIGAVTTAIVLATVLQLLSVKPVLKEFAPQGTAVAPTRTVKIFDSTPAIDPSSKTREG